MDSPEVTTVLALLQAYRNVIVEGVSGTGKSFLIEALRQEFGARNVQVVVFHPAKAYEDFVEGLRPRNESFEVEDGTFLRTCRLAAQEAADAEREGRDPATFVLVLDEINRANTAKVLGDLLFALEPSKREPVGRIAESVLAAKSDPPTIAADWSPSEGELWIELQSTRTEMRAPGDAVTYQQRLVVPDNLLVLGTMNTTDRSVGTVDLALRRRFVFHRLEPLGPDALMEQIGDSRLQKPVEQWHLLNSRLRAHIGADAQLGHSYLFQFSRARDRAPQAPLDIWRDLLLPQLAEVLVAFNAVELASELLHNLETGGFTLRKVGKGIDAYPMIESVQESKVPE
jgi:hypothetical protein